MNQMKVKYFTEENGKFVIENYNWAKSFTDFFPGIAGKLGIPMWVYFVSRGQAISSMGIRDKNSPIMKFRSFNDALQSVSTRGFRTFIKTGKNIYEPFRKTADENIIQQMTISAYELELTETNKNLGLEFNVLYFPIVNTFFAGFARILSIKNISETDTAFEVIDGLPEILTTGIDLESINTIPRHIQGLMKVDDVAGVPAFRLKQSNEDTEKVSEIKECNYYLSSFSDNLNPRHNAYIIDPYIIFGENESFEFPWGFKQIPLDELLQQKQIRSNRTPCAFTGANMRLSAQESKSINSIIGAARGDEILLNITDAVARPPFFPKKRRENKTFIEKIEDISFTASNIDTFNKYCEQTFLDNVVRGGMPVVFKTAGAQSAFYLFARLHGDPERDYLFFTLEPAYFSQGNGHYRDINQNRRSDVLFFPEIQNSNIITFLNLLQTDGYNPLDALALTYHIVDTERMEEWLKTLTNDADKLSYLSAFLKGNFTPGQFLLKLEDADIPFRHGADRLLSKLLSFSIENEIGSIHVGFWIDHWTYNLDLIENYLAVFPDKVKQLFLEKREYSFYDDPDVTQPRDKKFVLIEERVFQYDAVIRDEKKQSRIKSRSVFPKSVHTENGAGDVYRTNFLAKVLSLIANRIASLDADGLGTEMEANKPGWNDSMNGLPGILGSSIGESADLERALSMLLDNLGKIDLPDDYKQPLFAELFEFIEHLDKLLSETMMANDKNKHFTFWDKSHSFKEIYREKTKYGVVGKEYDMPLHKIKSFLQKALAFVSRIFTPQNLTEIFDPNGVPYTYFYYKVEDYEFLNKKNQSGYPLVRVKRLKRMTLPLFLEGPTHIMRVHPELAEKIYNSVKKSDIYDKKLKMYKVCASLEKAPTEIGRIKGWGRGWIENESVYTHMEFKYLLEILRSGLYEQFFDDIRTCLIPFLNPKIYGRSLFENVSFIVSSAFPDEKMHGQGFQPRLSGVTCEMISMWLIMTVGEKPFYLNNKNELNFRLEPHLADWLFTTAEKSFRYFDANGSETNIKLPKNSFAFKFFSEILVIYHNKNRRNTFGSTKAEIKSYILYYKSGEKIKIPESFIGFPLAKDIRERKIYRIDAFLE